MEINKKCINSFGEQLLRKPRREICDNLKTDFREKAVPILIELIHSYIHIRALLFRFYHQ
jgi:hypothetical protein